MTDSKIKAARILMGEWHASEGGGAQLRRVCPHIVSLGAGLFAVVEGCEADGDVSAPILGLTTSEQKSSA
jgi:hypothetical protein